MRKRVRVLDISDMNITMYLLILIQISFLKRGGGVKIFKNLGFVTFRSPCTLHQLLVGEKMSNTLKTVSHTGIFRLVGSTSVSHSTGSTFESLSRDMPRNRRSKQFSSLPSDKSRTGFNTKLLRPTAYTKHKQGFLTWNVLALGISRSRHRTRRVSELSHSSRHCPRDIVAVYVTGV